MTKGLPGGIIFPVGAGIGATQEVWAVMSPILAEGIIIVLTVMDPFVIIPGPPGTQLGKMHGAVLHRAVAAGLFPIMTVGLPSMSAKGRPG